MDKNKSRKGKKLVLPEKLELEEAEVETSQPQNIPSPIVQRLPPEGEESTPVEADRKSIYKYRPPPRGLSSNEYSLCLPIQQNRRCSLGDQCIKAHSTEELYEWKNRFESTSKEIKDELKIAKAFLREKETMAQSISRVKCYTSTNLNVQSTCKSYKHEWSFTLTSKEYLKDVFLLEDANRANFGLTSITIGPRRSQEVQNLPKNCQHWKNTRIPDKSACVYRVKVAFSNDIYGTFKQRIVFDFGTRPALAKQISVETTPIIEKDKATSCQLTISKRWIQENVTIVPFESRSFFSKDEQSFLDAFKPPNAEHYTIPASLKHGELSLENYKERMQTLLDIEEMAQTASVSKYNLTATVDIVDRFLLVPGLNSGLKFAQNGQLFGRLQLQQDISEDTSHGRLILQYVNTVYVCPASTYNKDSLPSVIYEAQVEERGKNFLFLRLSPACTRDLQLKSDMHVQFQIQFEINRLHLCQMRYALQEFTQMQQVLFPTLEHVQPIPWSPVRQWSPALDSRLNAKQKEAVLAITANATGNLSPILLAGPYGTGKTFTLAQAALQLIAQPNCNLLICTHSNSAADLYIKEYFHPYVESTGRQEARPLRVMYRKRWKSTLDPVVLKYCLVNNGCSGDTFRQPTRQDLASHRVVVCTLSTSSYLFSLDLEPGTFSHILIDEAAQAQEPHTLLPLCFAGSNSRIVLAGDHMQLGPEIHSDYSRQKGLGTSLLERLYQYYPHQHPCKILLIENYRSHEDIVKYTSSCFYDAQLLSRGSQFKHFKLHPLCFFTARGQDKQITNSTSYHNDAEVYEIVEQVEELIKTWPKEWGELNESSIGVLTYYSEQVARIRSEFRKRMRPMVSVERVLNVQGKQFRAVFISTVRTSHTCKNDTDDDVDYGFLSNAKLLNTAVTRAQSLVAVVGDPVSLCSIGRCRKLWEKYIEICHESKSLFGMTWVHLNALLNKVELLKASLLNPLAPEYVPLRLRQTGSNVKPPPYHPQPFYQTFPTTPYMPNLIFRPTFNNLMWSPVNVYPGQHLFVPQQHRGHRQILQQKPQRKNFTRNGATPSSKQGSSDSGESTPVETTAQTVSTSSSTTTQTMSHNTSNPLQIHITTCPHVNPNAFPPPSALNAVVPQQLLNNPHLTNQVYSYLLHTEGVRAATTFMTNVQQQLEQRKRSTSSSSVVVSVKSGKSESSSVLRTPDSSSDEQSL